MISSIKQSKTRKLSKKRDEGETMVDHVVLTVDECNPSVPLCRICHEEEDEDPKNMESPCACSGTLKYAHRKCIQRWCNEKGNTVCEICLQKFEPGYTAPAKTEAFGRLPLFIRGETHSSIDQELQNPGLIAIVAAEGDFLESNYRESSLSTCCRSVALTFTVILLIHHVLVLLRDEKDQYVFTLFTLFLLRASGILLPFYIMALAISAIQHRQQENLQYDGFHTENYDDDDDAIDDDDDDDYDDHDDFVDHENYDIEQQLQHRGV